MIKYSVVYVYRDHTEYKRSTRSERPKLRIQLYIVLYGVEKWKWKNRVTYVYHILLLRSRCKKNNTELLGRSDLCANLRRRNYFRVQTRLFRLAGRDGAGRAQTIFNFPGISTRDGRGCYYRRRFPETVAITHYIAAGS